MTRAAAAGADVRQRHRAGDALAGVRGDRARAGAARAAAGGAGAERRRDERVAHHRPDRRRRASSPAWAAPTCSRSTPCCRSSAAFIIWRWSASRRSARCPASASSARCASALQYVRQSRAHARRCCCASALFFLQSTALIGAAAAGGAPACTAAAPAPSRCCWRRWARARSSRRCCCRACARAGPRRARRCAARCCRPRRSSVVAFAPNVWVAAPAMVVAGAAWISVANSLTGLGAARAARLGARARHVDLPDGADGRQRARRGAVGPGRDAGPACAPACWLPRSRRAGVRCWSARACGSSAAREEDLTPQRVLERSRRRRSPSSRTTGRCWSRSST